MTFKEANCQPIVKQLSTNCQLIVNQLWTNCLLSLLRGRKLKILTPDMANISEFLVLDTLYLVKIYYSSQL